MAWIVLIVSVLVIVVCIRGLLRTLIGPSKYWNGPAPTKEQRIESRHFIAEFIEQWPNSGLSKDFPDLAEQARITRAYKQLEERYAAGEIDELDYQLELEKLTGKIDLYELTEKPPSIPYQRFY